MYCTQCGSYLPIQRKRRKQKETGHLKALYCIRCKKETNHAEVNGGTYTHDTFLLEFENGNFDKEGNRVNTLNNFLATMRKEGKI